MSHNYSLELETYLVKSSEQKKVPRFFSSIKATHQLYLSRPFWAINWTPEALKGPLKMGWITLKAAGDKNGVVSQC